MARIYYFNVMIILFYSSLALEEACLFFIFGLCCLYGNFVETPRFMIGDSLLLCSIVESSWCLCYSTAANGCESACAMLRSWRRSSNSWLSSISWISRVEACRYILVSLVFIRWFSYLILLYSIFKLWYCWATSSTSTLGLTMLRPFWAAWRIWFRRYLRRRAYLSLRSELLTALLGISSISF